MSSPLTAAVDSTTDTTSTTPTTTTTATTTATTTSTTPPTPPTAATVPTTPSDVLSVKKRVHHVIPITRGKLKARTMRKHANLLKFATPGWLICTNKSRETECCTETLYMLNKYCDRMFPINEEEKKEIQLEKSKKRKIDQENLLIKQQKEKEKEKEKETNGNTVSESDDDDSDDDISASDDGDDDTANSHKKSNSSRSSLKKRSYSSLTGTVDAPSFNSLGVVGLKKNTSHSFGRVCLCDAGGSKGLLFFAITDLNIDTHRIANEILKDAAKLVIQQLPRQHTHTHTHTHNTTNMPNNNCTSF